MDWSSIACVEGPNLTLRLIKPEDAAYVHGLRTNPLYNSHLSKVTGTVQDQRAGSKVTSLVRPRGRNSTT